MALLAANNRGSAVLEAAFSVMLGFAAVAGLLLLLYLGFTRAWLSVQAEQALLCASEGRQGCSSMLKEKSQAFLPWGKVSAQVLRKGEEKWELKVSWRLGGLQMRIHRLLDIKKIARSRAFPLSPP